MEGGRRNGGEVRAEGGGLEPIGLEEAAADGLKERLPRVEAYGGKVVRVGGKGFAAKRRRGSAEDDATERIPTRGLERKDDKRSHVEAGPEWPKLGEGAGPLTRLRREDHASGSREASEGRARARGIVGDEGDMAAMGEDEAAKLGMNEQTEGGRRAIDQMPPRRNQGGVNAQTASTEVAATHRSGAMEARDVATATGDLERCAEAVE